jgi:hypothetical protein
MLTDLYGIARGTATFPVFSSMSCRGSCVLGMDQSPNSGGPPPANTVAITHSATPALASTFTLAATRSTGTDPVSAVRQSYVYTSYTPGVGKEAMFTGILKTGTAPTVTGPGQAYSRIGLFSASSGVFWQYDPHPAPVGTVSVNVMTAGEVVASIAQADFNTDNLSAITVPAITGTGVPVPAPIEWTAFQLLYIDYEWLGSGSVRFGVMVGGNLVLAHTVTHYNALMAPYMQIPNAPARYEATVTGAATGTMQLIQGCCTVATSATGLALRTVNISMAYASAGPSPSWAAAETPILAIRGQQGAAASDADGARSCIALFMASTARIGTDTIIFRLYRCFSWGGAQYGTVTSTGPGDDATNAGFVNPFPNLPSASSTAPACLVEICDPSLSTTTPATTLTFTNRDRAQLIAASQANKELRFGSSFSSTQMELSLPVGGPPTRAVATVYVMTAQKYNNNGGWSGVGTFEWRQET